MQVTATDADDPTYGNSARLVYSILQGQPYFSVEPQTGETENCYSSSSVVLVEFNTDSSAKLITTSQHIRVRKWGATWAT